MKTALTPSILTVDDRIITDSTHISQRLMELGISKDALIEVIQAAIGARNNVTPLHPKSAGGMTAWIEGTYRLRAVSLASGWIPHIQDNIEFIYNEKTQTKIAYQNAERAGELNFDPIAASKKGAGSARAVASGQWDLFPESLKEIHERDQSKVWYLFVYSDGIEVCAELSCPETIENGEFRGFSQRILLVQPGEWDSLDLTDDGNGELELDVSVTRKVN